MPRRVFIFLKKTGNSVSYLPHRQLRNLAVPTNPAMIRYLPHRQLRKQLRPLSARSHGYLPHRQLRKP